MASNFNARWCMSLTLVRNFEFSTALQKSQLPLMKDLQGEDYENPLHQSIRYKQGDDFKKKKIFVSKYSIEHETDPNKLHKS